MSEDRFENGENEPEWLEFVLSAVNSDYDIPWRVRSDMISGIHPASLNTLANRNGYGHVMSNEPASAAGRLPETATDEERQAFMHKWRLAKREQIISGEYSAGTRGGPRGPRLSEQEAEERSLALLDIQARWVSKGNELKDFPKGKKGLINGQPVDYWIKAVLDRYPDMKTKAAANIAARKAEAEAAKARLVEEAAEDPFADLLRPAA